MTDMAHVRGLIFRADLSADAGDVDRMLVQLREAIRSGEEIARTRSLRIVTGEDHAGEAFRRVMRGEGA